MSNLLKKEIRNIIKENNFKVIEPEEILKIQNILREKTNDLKFFQKLLNLNYNKKDTDFNFLSNTNLNNIKNKEFLYCKSNINLQPLNIIDLEKIGTFINKNVYYDKKKYKW